MNELTLHDSQQTTISSLDISRVVESKHAAVRISIERLMDKGVISRSSLTTYKNINNLEVEGYAISKRDSYVVVAQLSPEFTGRLVDRWQELESSQANKQAIALIDQVPFKDTHGRDHISLSTKIPGKGQVYLEKRYRIDGDPKHYTCFC